jgi:hypothetical protein
LADAVAPFGPLKLDGSNSDEYVSVTLGAPVTSGVIPVGKAEFDPLPDATFKPAECGPFVK